MIKVSREMLQSTLSELDQAVHNHDLWYKELIRSIVCQLKHDPREFSDDSHRQCRFGQWFYSMSAQELHDHPSYLSIETEHMRMHQLANKLLTASSNNETISPTDYDRFANTIERLRLNINTLKFEIEENLYKRDPLTGLRNRVSMLSELRYMHELVKRHTQNITIALMDIDLFKNINDDYGHPIGDKVLSGVAEFILKHTRPYDKIYRYGGEEFLLCIAGTDIHTAYIIIERLREALSHCIVVNEGDIAISVTASFGLAALEADSSVDDAIIRADEALYVSKKSGRNVVSVWDITMH